MTIHFYRIEHTNTSTSLIVDLSTYIGFFRESHRFESPKDSKSFYDYRQEWFRLFQPMNKFDENFYQMIYFCLSKYSFDTEEQRIQLQQQIGDYFSGDFIEILKNSIDAMLLQSLNSSKLISHEISLTFEIKLSDGTLELFFMDNAGGFSEEFLNRVESLHEQTQYLNSPRYSTKSNGYIGLCCGSGLAMRQLICKVLTGDFYDPRKTIHATMHSQRYIEFYNIVQEGRVSGGGIFLKVPLKDLSHYEHLDLNDDDAPEIILPSESIDIPQATRITGYT